MSRIDNLEGTRGDGDDELINGEFVAGDGDARWRIVVVGERLSTTVEVS